MLSALGNLVSHFPYPRQNGGSGTVGSPKVVAVSGAVIHSNPLLVSCWESYKGNFQIILYPDAQCMVIFTYIYP